TGGSRDDGALGRGLLDRRLVAERAQGGADARECDPRRGRRPKPSRSGELGAERLARLAPANRPGARGHRVQDVAEQRVLAPGVGGRRGAGAPRGAARGGPAAAWAGRPGPGRLRAAGRWARAARTPAGTSRSSRDRATLRWTPRASARSSAVTGRACERAYRSALRTPGSPTASSSFISNANLSVVRELC